MLATRKRKHVDSPAAFGSYSSAVPATPPQQAIEVVPTKAPVAKLDFEADSFVFVPLTTSEEVHAPARIEEQPAPVPPPPPPIRQPAAIREPIVPPVRLVEETSPRPAKARRFEAGQGNVALLFVAAALFLALFTSVLWQVLVPDEASRPDRLPGRDLAQQGDVRPEPAIAMAAPAIARNVAAPRAEPASFGPADVAAGPKIVAITPAIAPASAPERDRDTLPNAAAAGEDSSAGSIDAMMAQFDPLRDSDPQPLAALAYLPAVEPTPEVAADPAPERITLAALPMTRVGVAPLGPAPAAMMPPATTVSPAATMSPAAPAPEPEAAPAPAILLTAIMPEIGIPEPPVRPVAIPVESVTPVEASEKPRRRGRANRPDPVAAPAISDPGDDGLLARADRLLSAGDIAAARLVLARAAQTDSPQALLRLAESFDPNVLASMNVRGIRADEARARDLYGRAGQLGSQEAQARLERLSAAR